MLGSLLALALTRFDFFGKKVINLLLILPIALPGIVTGIALQSTIQNVLLLRSSLVAGALLAFGLSFDEIVVTTFTAGPGTPTLPIWIFDNLFRPNQAPVVNVVAVVIVLISIVPVWAAQRLSSDTAGGRL